MIKTSVIIPVYNTQEYIGECLESLFNQTQKDIEIIAVDDGSTDNSLEILKSYQRKHDNLVVISQENKKLGGARNTGMEVAQGECIYFIDSDDVIDKNTLEILYCKVMNYKLDIVSFDAETFGDLPDDKGRFRYYDRSDVGIDPDSVYSGFDFWNRFYLMHDPMITAWSFYFRKEFLDKYDIRFQENLFFEDGEFAVRVYLKAERMMYVPQKLYRRRIRQGSIMLSQFDLPHLKGILSNTRLICRYINEDMHTYQEKRLFLKFWRSQFFKILRQWHATDAQKDKDAMELAGGIIDELAESTFLFEYIDRKFYRDLLKFMKWLQDEACFPKGRMRIREVMEEWHIKNAWLCVFGAGKVAEKVITMLHTGELKYDNVIFAVTEFVNDQKEFQGYPMIEIKDLSRYADMADILIASTKYEDEMLKTVHLLFSDEYPVKTYRELLLQRETKVSVIVPVYNGENYLKRCISSLLKQTYENIEIIIINDGSTDNSLSISKSYIKNEKRCIVMDQPNRGVTAARREGIRIATGDYVMFVDSDDWIEPNTVERMVALQKQACSDIVVTGHLRETGKEEGEKQRGKIPAGIYEESMLKIFYKRMFYVDPISGWGVWPTLWGKLFRKSIVKDVIEQVDDRIIYGEDVAVVFTACFSAKKIVISEEFLYHYFVANETAVSRTKDIRLLNSMYFLYEHMRNLFSQQDEKEILMEQLGWYMNNIMNHLSRILFGVPYHLGELIYAKKEIEQWKSRYVNLESDIENRLNTHDWILPYCELENMQDIVIWGKGGILQSYKKQLENDGRYTVIMQLNDVSEIRKLSNVLYDCILLVTDNIYEKCMMEMELLKWGIDNKKIVWKEPFKG